MVKWVVVELSDREYQILEKLDDIEGDSSQKLRKLLRDYLFTTPRFHKDYHIIHLEEKKEFLFEILVSIWKEYESSTSPLEKWDEEKVKSIRDDLMEINAIRPVGPFNFTVTGLLKKPWLAAYYHVSKIFEDLDEFSQACIASIYVLDFLSKGTFESDVLKNSTILLNELFMFSYAVARKQAHETQESFKRRSSSPGSDNKLPA
jgi:hypothetical protein